MKTKLTQLKLTKKGYGLFPYIILRIDACHYMQVPIHFVKGGGDIDINKHLGVYVDNVPLKILLTTDRETQLNLFHDDIIEATKTFIGKFKQYNKKEPELCIVFGKDRALFYNEGIFKESNAIPTGGILVSQTNVVLAKNAEHYIEGYKHKETKLFNEEFSHTYRNTFHIPMDLSEVNAIHIKCDFNTVRVADYETEDKNIIITIENKIGNSLIDFTKASDYRMYCFNENQVLTSRHYALNNSSNFIIQTPQKFILLIKH